MAISYWGKPKAILLLFALATNLTFTACTGSGSGSSDGGSSAPITEGPQGPAAVPGVNITRVSSSVSANPLIAGQVQTAKVALKSDVSLTDVIVDIRIYNSAGSMITKKNYPSVAFPANTVVNLEYAYQSASSLPAGAYNVQVGMWNTAWATYYYEWTSQFNVVAADTTAPSTSTCVYPTWNKRTSYAAGSIVTYNGKFYKAKYANRGSNPANSTYYWAVYTCSSTSTTTTTTTTSTTVPATPTTSTTTTTTVPAPTSSVPSAPTTIEAESMETKVGGGAWAPGWGLYSNDNYVENRVNFATSGTYSFNVTALSTMAAGIGAEAQIFIDGVAVGSRHIYNSTAASAYTFTATVSAGTRKVAVRFTNDAMVDGQDRNLIVDKVSIAAGAPSSTPTPTPPATGGNPLAGAKLFINPWTGAMNNLNYCPQMSKIAYSSIGIWMAGGTITDATRDLTYLLAEADKQAAVATILIYNIPNRDCGSYSGGGTSAADYNNYVSALARVIGNRKHVVIMEPDAIAGADCLTAAQRTERFNLIKTGMQSIRSLAPNALIYLDAGNPRWHSVASQSSLLKEAGIDIAHGFALNVSNFITTAENRTYGDAISAQVGGKHYVIDTSRNGNGPGDTWCNPLGRALGERPVGFSSGLVDAYLWAKPPGDSDGSCNGFPSAGTFMPQYACDMAARAAW